MWACAPELWVGAAALPSAERVFVSVETIGGSFMTHDLRGEIAERAGCERFRRGHLVGSCHSGAMKVRGMCG